GGRGGRGARLGGLRLPVALGGLVGCLVGSRRQVAKRGQDAPQLAQVLVALGQTLCEGGQGGVDDGRVGTRRHRQPCLVIPEGEGPIVVDQADLSSFEHTAVLVLQQGKQDLVFQVGVHGAPVNIEEGRVS